MSEWKNFTTDKDKLVDQARTALRNATLFGQPVNTQDDKDVISTLYAHYMMAELGLLVTKSEKDRLRTS